ncbi:50S ribosomal protein L32 [Sedimentisphaera cyanobacteriorum]|uniref:Large ribosomal subunit protein bL32 n=1 Tax=Sedimentisphaera cyanobacteriorum TaxID=1940790 RepID=A0A1Q2HLV7_9BACT|nr:50S ribosomal protein L32 [Sedimentisphaera cyanobacteriorum]AQQ08422.1 50S ribosomal protein L32 [Sedimentisphaera cyanobacteriorum]
MQPVKKTSRSRTRTRRAHHALRPVNYSVCQQCGDSKLPHAACGNCGYYNKKISIDIDTEAAS